IIGIYCATLSLPQPDHGVLRKAQRGDERAFSIIVRAYQIPVYNYVLRMVGDLDDIPPLEVLDAPFERLEAIDAVWRAVEGLSVDLKMALLLRDVVGLSYGEIAESLEVTLATVKWRIWKAREDVQLSLAREGIEVFEEREVPAVAPPAALAPVAT